MGSVGALITSTLLGLVSILSKEQVETRLKYVSLAVVEVTTSKTTCMELTLP